MLSNAYFLAKFRFDTAENEPAKKLQNFANLTKLNLKICQFCRKVCSNEGAGSPPHQHAYRRVHCPRVRSPIYAGVGHRLEIAPVLRRFLDLPRDARLDECMHYGRELWRREPFLRELVPSWFDRRSRSHVDPVSRLVCAFPRGLQCHQG